MRVVAEIPHPDVKITVFSWNEKFLVKLEKGPYEQTFKISQLDIAGEDELKQMLDEPFLDAALKNFGHMHLAWRESRERQTGF